MFFRKTIEDIKSKYERLKIYVDMDGVIADYIVGEARDYDKKRPLLNNIKQLEEISKIDNIELYILSVSRMDIGVEEKNRWLDKYAPFFRSENRIIIPRESKKKKKSYVLKCNYVKSIERIDNCKIIVIDDDCDIVHKLKDQNDDIIILKDTVFVD